MHGILVMRAWKWLLAHLVIAASIGYLATLLVAALGFAKPAALLKATTFGLPHFGAIILARGTTLGLDPGVVIFFCNLAVSLLIIANIYLSRGLNPRKRNHIFSRLYNRLLRDPSVEHLRRIPPFARILSPNLLLTSFLLLAAPYVATVTLGLLAGSLLGIVLLQTSSPLIALAYIAPHGIPEISALLLACSIPVGMWMAIRPVIEKESSTEAFQRIENMVTSQQLQQNLKMIINLLMIAGMIEAHFTLSLVAMFSGS